MKRSTLVHTSRRLLLLLTLLIVSGAPALADMRIFELEHRSATELANTVRALVGEEAKVAVHRNTLVVRSTPALINEVAQLVAAYDKPISMLRISVEQGRSVDNQRQRALASGNLQVGAVTLGAPPAPVADTSVFVSTGDVNVRMQGNDVVRYENREVGQFVSVLDGSPATILVGRAVPFTSRLRFYSQSHSRFVESIEYQHVDTGFEVLPEVVGDHVRLQVRPFMAFLDATSPGQIVFQEMAATVKIPMGAWYDLSAHMSVQNSLSREILGIGNQSGSDLNYVRIRIEKEL